MKFKTVIKHVYHLKILKLMEDIMLIEAKPKTGNTKSSKTVMKHPEHYGKTKLIKIGDYNISEEGDIITIPHYLTFVLGKIKYDF